MRSEYERYRVDEDDPDSDTVFVCVGCNGAHISTGQIYDLLNTPGRHREVTTSENYARAHQRRCCARMLAEQRSPRRQHQQFAVRRQSLRTHEQALAVARTMQLRGTNSAAAARAVRATEQNNPDNAPFCCLCSDPIREFADRETSSACCKQELHYVCHVNAVLKMPSLSDRTRDRCPLCRREKSLELRTLEERANPRMVDDAVKPWHKRVCCEWELNFVDDVQRYLTNGNAPGRDQCQKCDYRYALERRTNALIASFELRRRIVPHRLQPQPTVAEPRRLAVDAAIARAVAAAGTSATSQPPTPVVVTGSERLDNDDEVEYIRTVVRPPRRSRYRNLFGKCIGWKKECDFISFAHHKSCND